MLTRRAFLGGSLATVGLACGPRRGPTILTKQPGITHGVQAGDPTSDPGGTRANIWARCDEPDVRMVVEWDTTDKFDKPRRSASDVVGQTTDCCALVGLTGLPAAQTIFYRARFEREAARGTGAWTTGRLRTPRPDRVRVAWTGDTCGQGYGRTADHGLIGFEAIGKSDPDVFVNSGDLFYADSPILAERKHPDGRIWKNITNERVGRVAQELDDFRARLSYNFDDEHMRAFAAQVPVIAQWDDHETRNDWFPGQQLDADKRYTMLRDAQKLSELSKRAIFEWMPITRGPVNRVIHYGPLLDIFVLDARTFRSPNTPNNVDDEVMFGAAQTRWLIDAMRTSKARWRIVACDQPIAAVIRGELVEGFANGDPGPPRGREKELVQILQGITASAGGPDADARPRTAHNTIWITADIHYAAAHHFDPARSQTSGFDPFWEFVAGPIHAGNFGPNTLDPTLGPEVKFTYGTLPAPDADVGPAEGLQNFGTIDVTRDAMTVALRSLDGKAQFEIALPYNG